MNPDAAVALEQIAPAVRHELAAAGLSSDRIDVHYQYLASAVSAGRASLYGSYVVWQNDLDRHHAHSGAAVELELELLARALRDRGSPELFTLCSAPLVAARSALKGAAVGRESLLSDDLPQAALAREYLRRLFDGDRRSAMDLLLGAVEDGLSIEDLYLDVMQPCQWEIGRLWQANELSVGQEHFCTAVSQAVMARLYERIFDATPGTRRMLASTMDGELHELGIRMVSDLLELNGWDTTYLGSATPANDLMERIAFHDTDLLAVSVTRTPNLPAAARLIAELRADPSFDRIRVIVGGHAFNAEPDLWTEMGADAWAPDAREAVTTAARLVSM